MNLFTFAFLSTRASYEDQIRCLPTKDILRLSKKKSISDNLCKVFKQWNRMKHEFLSGTLKYISIRKIKSYVIER